MDFYSALQIPASCLIDKIIAKKMFLDNAALSKSDKALFSDVVERIRWKYCLKEEFIPIHPYQDDERDYPEVEILEVVLKQEKGLRRLAEIVMRSIPYPMLLVFRLDDQIQIWMAQQRISQADHDKITLEEFMVSPQLQEGDSFWTALSIRNLRPTNFYDFYSDWLDRLSIQKAKEQVPSSEDLNGEEARMLLAQRENMEKEIAILRAELKKETQFSRKVELNMKIKRLEREKLI